MHSQCLGQEVNMATEQGGIQHFTVQEAGNVNLGQGGSVFLDTDSTVFTPTKGVVIAITALNSMQFDVLTAEDSSKYFGVSGLGAAGDGWENKGDALTTSDSIPAGLTIYGRWTSVSVKDNNDKCICYIGS